MTELPDLETASIVTGIAPEKIQLLRAYRKNAERYNGGNHPFPMELCPVASCLLLTSFHYAQQELMQPALYKEPGNAIYESWNISGMPRPFLWNGLAPLIQQQRDIQYYIFGIDKDEAAGM